MRISDWSSDVCSSDLRDCPSHGILGADNNSGSFTLEYSEIFNSGYGTRRHSIYMQSDEVAYPGSVFRMQYNYVHSPTGGVLVRVSHERAKIYYNWNEGDTSTEPKTICQEKSVSVRFHLVGLLTIQKKLNKPT